MLVTRLGTVISSCGLALLLTACGGTQPPHPGPNGPSVGGSKDTHGCMTGAGYSWCAKENQCVRPWEVVTRQALTTSEDAATRAAAFNRYCAN